MTIQMLNTYQNFDRKTFSKVRLRFIWKAPSKVGHHVNLGYCGSPPESLVQKE